MRNRWGILAILFVVRLTIAFQFQSVAAVAPLLQQTFGVGLADIGILIGLYFTPGIVLALPGGAIGRTLGDKPTTIAALLLMTAGSLVMATTDIWGWQMAGRLVSGAGGVLLTVQLTKMGTDWFAGKEIATAMAIFVNSWPAGVAISLLVLPAIGTAYGASAVFLAAGALTAISIVLITLYQSPPGATVSAAGPGRLDHLALLAVIVAGLIWGLFNVGFAMIFSFGPSLLAERGWSIAAAGSAISLVMWLSVISVPAGGYLADRFKRPLTLATAASLIVAALLAWLPRSDAVITVLVLIGLIGGHPAGPIMSLAARVLAPETRAIGMGVFYTLFYAAMMLGPAVAGRLAKSAGTAAVALDLGALTVLACPPLMWLFERIVSVRNRRTQS
ncbi:arabinose ABC transporter permease [Bradyrhizobium japonicum]|uniref:Arabinose ABC transporter permease n=1 Tax=Bradyrhizobium japonicum TaxID=375 RepID=A0A0A3XR58_BRAJP|nr:MFS transporter [Bradyrhizobium japonicum]KGT75769.1 arabinose ABC transporter permease [Bradyrhizobium japonicum]MCS3895059.1 putative MFS family arabinose efflux permease [Bradyrhizobium japonicum USDA 38]MCS3947574.1 putative MFS family arabinose efflux permease [Bradyrhizobium japonicum]MCW2219595.1 putative MFS family arabinose efflux permease [Bradyrhizobium japonicum]MCW2344209.1 putative MFS family arabinose efflux permease [Bradyrhizobium japonicum]